ncbi:uncharacterized protein RCC_07709 [Ramularia collo-cygni]|uniref:RNase MRP protein 1 RNA binding domain-containing protein n=1 Tax=Ramularia collo-cygni TaxID=112498 RepID=A0A2D3UVR7_9PEZI|nr:uncharacterized protein RCC_07709 [Ramularia collo-cygni]CZT21842.1 uncharacterized protein RCC_07709 [Ramularia collo-cygni]
MAADQDISISTDSQKSLQHLSDLIHLFNHRNKNQHRRSIWWRQFSTFRHQIDSLCADISSLNEVPTTNLGRAKKKVNDARIISNTEKRLVFWQEVMVSKWQHAFSQLIADGRFSVLGLVLLAVLSEVCQIVGVTARLEDLGQIEVEKVLQEFGREEWGVDGAVTRSLDSAREDQGEVIQRDDGDMDAAIPAQEAVLPKPKAGTKRVKETSAKTSKKKRKKGGDAIDDLFNF